MNLFSNLIGNEPIKEYLTRMVRKQAIANSLLFAGPSGIGKSLFAQKLAELVISTDGGPLVPRHDHPDIHHYRPEGKMGLHSIQSLRQLIEEVYLPPFEATWKTFIIHEANHMLSYSANALLKTFEEPPPRTQIILLSSSPASLLPTIRSRCRILYFQSIPHSEIQIFLQQNHSLSSEASQKIALQADGSLGRAIELIENGDDPLRHKLFEILIKGPISPYREFSENIRQITEEVELLRKEREERAKNQLEFISAENLSAVQRGILEKELEGVGAMKFVESTQVLLGYLQSWYRDLHLLVVNGSEEYLLNPDYSEQMREILKRKKPISQERVGKIMDEAILSLQRSTSLQICLESTLLKLLS